MVAPPPITQRDIWGTIDLDFISNWVQNAASHKSVDRMVAESHGSTDLLILSVQDMVISCSPCRMPSHVCTGPRLRTGTVPSPDSILVRRWLRCFLMRCLLLCTANTIHAITAPSVHVPSAPPAHECWVHNAITQQQSRVNTKLFQIQWASKNEPSDSLFPRMHNAGGARRQCCQLPDI